MAGVNKDRDLQLGNVNALFSYEAESGLLRWKVKNNGMKIGQIAGSLDSKGHVVVRIKGQGYQAHRICWFIKTGKWPDQQIDHINHDRSDNRWVNLRHVSPSENQKNRKLNSNNTSGCSGVVWRASSRKWEASIKVNGKAIYIGRFEELTDAVKARKAAESKHGFHRNHGIK